MTTKQDDLRRDFPPGLSQPALRALASAGYTRLDQLTRVKASDLLKLHGMGPKAIRLLREALEAGGLSFESEEKITMATEDEIFDSPTGWVRKHIEEYVESDGEKGHRWRGYPALLLTTRGRKTGKLRRTALIYGRDGENYLLVASKGGAPHHPLWYLNLAKNPEVELQVGAKKIRGRARTAGPEEKPRLWRLMVGVYPPYDEYQAKTGREIPLVIVEPGKIS